MEFIENRYNEIHSLLLDRNINDEFEIKIQNCIDEYIKKNMMGKKIIFRCTGIHSMELLKKFEQNNCKVEMFLDKNSYGTVNGIPIYKPDIIKEIQFDYVVVASINFRKEIIDELKKYSISQVKVIDIYEVLRENGIDLSGAFYRYKSGSYEIALKFYKDYLKSITLEEKQKNLYNYIVSCLEMKNFPLFFKYAEVFIKNKYKNWSLIEQSVNEMKKLLEDIKILISKRKQKDIFIYWTDAVQQKYLKYMPYILKRKKESISFENTYSITPYTHQVMRAMFAKLKPIDDYEQSKTLLSEKNSIVIKYLLEFDYDIKHIGHDGYINFSMESIYRIDYRADVAVSLILWEAIKEMLKNEKPVFYIIHVAGETHAPCLSAELKEWIGDTSIVDIPEQQISCSYAAVSNLLEFYDEIIRSDNMYKIYMSDHGNHFEIPQWYWAQNKIKPYFYIYNSKIKAKEYYDIFSYNNFYEVIKWILDPQKNKLENSFSEYSCIQDVDIYNKTLVEFFISKNIKEYAMSYRGVVTVSDKYILRSDGKEFYYTIDENFEEIESTCEYNRLNYLRSLAGNKFIDIDTDNRFEYSRLLYKK
ncbi:hypothetical protein K7185_10495 [Clostridium butyricum]|uniref:hypothetical protein n=1 Tax=Clostridium butyricum TaxID=1492 RepID=UPI001CA824F9|nr:hypothetical protein [Clostridium butyricum]MBZ0312903.1 hypothetical protein [Clostridium butyricum]